MYDISVIIPVYNVEEYIRECLDSIVNQTLGLENIEVIIIDDSSSDNTVEIIGEYVDKYPSNFKLILQESNQGPGVARNKGLSIAKGKYITFMDGDDYISENTYQLCTGLLDNDEDLDLVVYKYSVFNRFGEILEPDIHQLIYEDDCVVSNPCRVPEIIFSTSPWNKVYSRCLLPFLVFPSMLYEDNITSVKSILNSKKIHVTTGAVYYYRLGDDSVSRSQNITSKNLKDLVLSIRQLSSLKKEYDGYGVLLDYLSLKFTYDILFWITGLDFPYNILVGVLDDLREIIKGFNQDLLDDFGSRFPIYEYSAPDKIKDLKVLSSRDYLVKYVYMGRFINPVFEASLYIDTGDGFCDRDKLVVDYELSDSIVLFFDLENYQRINALRFDPIENHMCTCKIQVSNESVKIIDSNSINPTSEYQTFITLDPQYILTTTEPIKKLEIKLEINTQNQKNIQETYNEQIKQIQGKIKGLEYEINARDKIITDKNNIIQERDKYIKEITESTSWKITQPLRKINKK